MATLPRNALEMLGQSPSLSGQREQQVINRAVVAAPTADAAEVVAAQGGARALQVASNTQEYQAEQQAFGTAADLASNARAQACCQKGRMSAVEKHGLTGYLPAMYKLAGLMSST